MSFLKPKPVAAPGPVQAAPLPSLPVAPEAPPPETEAPTQTKVPKSPEAPPTFGAPAPRKPKGKMQSSIINQSQWGNPTNSGTKTLVGQ